MYGAATRVRGREEGMGTTRILGGGGQTLHNIV
jgi:hypothetical protein